MKTQPFVSIIMPVYNASEYLHAAIDSILQQTYNYFEFIVLEDASTDNSREIIQSYTNARIVKYFNPQNQGLIHQLNKGLSIVKGKYIARMDADDIADPERLEKQVACMEQNPGIGVCGSYAQVISETGNPQKLWKMPQHHEDIQAELLEGAVLCHPTIMFRAGIVKQAGMNYSPDWSHLEDYELWTRLINKTRFYVIQEPLLYYRNHQTQVSNEHFSIQQEGMSKLIERQLQGINNMSDKTYSVVWNFLRGNWNKLNWETIPEHWNLFYKQAMALGYNGSALDKLYIKRLFYFAVTLRNSAFLQKLKFIKKNIKTFIFWSFKQKIYFLTRKR